MYRRSFVVSNFDKNTFLPKCITLIWSAGLSLGILADRFYGETYRACLLLAAHQIPDFKGILWVNFLPVLISAYAVYFFPSLLSAVSLIRGFLLGLGISGIAALCSSAACLIAGLLLFSQLCFDPILLWYWTRRKSRRTFFQDTLGCFAVGLAISWIDWAFIAPLLHEIMIF